MKEMKIADYQHDLFTYAKLLLGTDSPTGYTSHVVDCIGQVAKSLDFGFEKTKKGCGMIYVPGRDNSKKVAVSAHVDTLGAMVRSITGDGMLKFTPVGGPILPTLDGEYCKILTRNGVSYTGTILSLSPAAHVFSDASTRTRDDGNMAVRIDEPVKSREDVENLGICPGDYIFIDPKTVVTPSGFLKSRFIDDKGSAACLLTVLKILRDQDLRPQYNTVFFFSVYEETGHGASYLPAGLSELLAVDMGCVGDDLSCTEYDVSICAKDSHGPYDYEMVSRLVHLAQERNLDYAVDIYPRYGSDVGAAWSAGNDVKGALIGPGVHASHGMERTHYHGMANTIQLILAYLGC